MEILDCRLRIADFEMLEPYALCPMLYALCSMLYSLCSMATGFRLLSSVLCLLSSVLYFSRSSATLAISLSGAKGLVM